MRAYKHVLSYMFVCIQSYCKFWKLGKQAAPMGKFWAKNHGEFVAQKSCQNDEFCVRYLPTCVCISVINGPPTVRAFDQQFGFPTRGSCWLLVLAANAAPTKHWLASGERTRDCLEGSWRYCRILGEMTGRRTRWTSSLGRQIALVPGPWGETPHSLQPRPFGSTVWGGRTPWIFNGFERWWVEYNPSIQFIGLASRARKLPLRWANQFCLERSPGTYSILGQNHISCSNILLNTKYEK